MRRLIIILLLSLGCCTYAQHRVGVSLSPAMTWQLDSMSSTHSIPGASGGIGFAYQYQWEPLVLRTGFELGFAAMRQGVDSVLFSPDTLCHNRVDAMRMIEFAIPVMVGVQWQHFYALAGVRAIVAPDVSTVQRATIAIREQSDKYHDDYNRAFMYDHDIDSRGIMTVNPDIRACVELGGQWSMNRYFSASNTSPILQLGVFAEYGLLNACPKTYSSKANDASVKMDIKHSYHNMQGMKVTNLRAGIRLTLLFDASPNDCNCEWY